jgi:hypothetical protein
MEQFELKLGKIAQPVRVALTGTTVSPGIFEIMTVLGRERVVARLDRAIMILLNPKTETFAHLDPRVQVQGNHAKKSSTISNPGAKRGNSNPTATSASGMLISSSF